MQIITNSAEEPAEDLKSRSLRTGSILQMLARLLTLQKENLAIEDKCCPKSLAESSQDIWEESRYLDSHILFYAKAFIQGVEGETDVGQQWKHACIILLWDADGTERVTGVVNMKFSQNCHKLR